MRKVRLFSDWDGSQQLAFDVINRCTDSTNFQFGDVEFVWDDNYSYAVAFNFSADQVRPNLPLERVIGLVLEPRGILDVMYQGWEDFDPSPYAGYYSFADDMGSAYTPALGISLPSVPFQHERPNWHDRKTACMIVSDKTYTDFQVRRRAIFSHLLDSDLDIDFYGRNMEITDDPRVKGEIPLGGKAEILSQYKYVIDFENCATAVTDKFLDAVMCGAVPITNSVTLDALGFKDGYHWVNFEKEPGEAAKTVSWFLRPKMGSEPNKQLLSEVSSGRLNLANWINEKVSEL